MSFLGFWGLMEKWRVGLSFIDGRLMRFLSFLSIFEGDGWFETFEMSNKTSMILRIEEVFLKRNGNLKGSVTKNKEKVFFR